jgi:chemotaxis protein histidine kinase CheA
VALVLVSAGLLSTHPAAAQRTGKPAPAAASAGASGSPKPSSATAAPGAGGAATTGAKPNAPTTPAATTPSDATPAAAPAEPTAASTDTRSSAMAAYNKALAERHLEASSALSPTFIRERLLEAQELSSAGRRDEVIANLVRLVESPRFADYAESDEGHAATYALGDALASAGAHDPARGYLKRLLPLSPGDTYARRAVRRLAEIAIDTENIPPILDDLRAVPAAGQPPETRGEIAYLNGRAKQLAGDPDAAFKFFSDVSVESRFWAQAVYLSGLIEVERGRLKEGENLFCKVADPGRSDKTAPFFADEKFFAVRDLARLALGRVAHEQYRFDDARYYYYLVPQDSERLAEALYESATGRYEKKDYEAARDLLDELKALGVHHRYEDEAWVLSAYLDLARCRFEEADAQLKGFIAQYEPVRDAARRLASDERALMRLLDASRVGSDAAAEPSGVTPDAARTIAALVRIDAGYGVVSKRLAQLEREMSGLRGSMGQLDDLTRTLATTGGVRPNSEGLGEGPPNTPARARAEADGLRRQLEGLERAHAPAAEIAAIRTSLHQIEASLGPARDPGPGAGSSSSPKGTDLPGLLQTDRASANEFYAAADAARAKLLEVRTALAKDAVNRLNQRLSRLLRRARLARIESVLGRKRALEIEVEALAAGVLPQAALDSLEAPRYLKDSEEYWPFEGDDWPDEYVGGEGIN